MAGIPPSLGEILAIVNEVKGYSNLSEAQKWNYIRQALASRGVHYGSEKPLRALYSKYQRGRGKKPKKRTTKK